MNEFENTSLQQMRVRREYYTWVLDDAKANRSLLMQFQRLMLAKLNAEIARRIIIQ